MTVRRSILELPEEPMKVRWQDNRVGYFSSKYYTYTSSKDKLLTHEMIHRWRIEPKEGEWEKYFRGELVEPERKIVFYVDNAFPDKWREVVKQGVEDWNKAFEAAGFKNVMEARDYPDDPSFDPDDIRYNCIRYAVTDVANAMGPSYTDPARVRFWWPMSSGTTMSFRWCTTGVSHRREPSIRACASRFSMTM